ncbi:MAG: glycosyltransferase, partial [bacterium]
ALVTGATARHHDHLQLVVVANACADRTAAIAREQLARSAASLPAGVLTWRVEELTELGKPNAWNRFVHDYADPAAEYLVFMDADIRLLHPDTLGNLLRLLHDHPDVTAATDRPVKNLTGKRWKSPLDWLSLGATEMTRAAPGQLCGQCYALRSAFARRLWLPRSIIIEDGLIKAMAATACYTQPADQTRIRCAADAAHEFIAYTRPGDVFRNQRRQQIGQTLQLFLREYLHANQRPGEDAAAVLAREYARDPDWLATVARDRIATAGGWVIYSGALAVRFRRLRQVSWPKRLLLLPVAIAGFLFDLPVLLAANHLLKRRELAGIWPNKVKPS